MQTQNATEQSLPDEPSGLWNYEHMSVDFDEKQNRKAYWKIRNDPNNLNFTDEEVKNLVAWIKHMSKLALELWKRIDSK
ncbi:hypothetical protein H8S95_01880 [Pontibacter sp. KCTC 32443]|uniref:hypothetical protein n=1 Tax=Pontibacter TaxID=323449 RepID=UPI00164D8DFE|nr:MULTISPECIES: hypothetical protein [Pontibacter]MBC5772799.1 hypothetical protein [Pontibacter sp. KCTC 32443]